jgi:hypothetical protein
MFYTIKLVEQQTFIFISDINFFVYPACLMENESVTGAILTTEAAQLRRNSYPSPDISLEFAGYSGV